MKIDFKNKIVIVTGATRGIGKNIAENLYRLGAKLLLTGTDSNQVKAKNKALGRNKRIRYFHLDLLDENSVRKFLSDVGNLKKIDVCINNAGINRIDYAESVPLSDWDDIVKVNLRGPFILSREVGGIMKRNRYGRIVNIASIFGVITREKRAAYTATKSGLIGLTRTMAVELASYNILVNSVSPGFILTDLTCNILTRSQIKQLKSLIPARRLGTPEDVSRVVLFLASELNTYIAGQNIIVDGGYVDV